MKDLEYMRMALKLAQKGCGWVNPNPMVGAVIVKEKRVIGIGFHEKYGQLHAERRALQNCTESPKGATLYVTLEPCCHYGKTPPCTEAIVQSGIKRVVIGSVDPNPLVAGQGMAILQKHGMEVVQGVLKEECDALNKVFFHYIKNKSPYVVMKYAMTMDGKIATYTGLSKWITGEEARRRVHEDRHRFASIMVGVGTILSDDPMLTCRIKDGKNPIRIVCDSNLRTPVTANVVTTAAQVRTILVTNCSEKEKQQPFLEAGCEIIVAPKKEGYIDLEFLMKEIARREIDSVLLEGGATLHWSALTGGFVNRVQAYIAPKLFGGEGAKTPIGGMGVSNPKDAYQLINTKIVPIGVDILLESEVISCLPELSKK